ncbi:MAG: D-alanyl-D-alanine carboxypeptidase [Candidatus Xenolissoclinum pacificiensis L6]|uniref:serine-type D-Ala-D-Ala carboxypeptidase n=1 Tax=Candidatus Xenolissoclinum pacificiensis L6 TaxID=1401685 RepID=W2V0R9_9RICK|nr:MAG: D-alanyl-D-alanine carboxypeptidase [Candidatus Xenolissoclinum pacificiensis L6]
MKLITFYIFLAVIVPGQYVFANIEKKYSKIIFDENTQTVISEENADTRIFPSSMTKIMTLLVAFDKIGKGEISLSDQVTVSNRAWSKKGSSMFLKEGQQVSIEDLITGVIVVSGNDASIALAEGISGSVEEFVKEMNALALSIGLKQSHFVNPSGWPEDNHYMSTRDILKISREIFLKYPEYHKIFTLPKFTFNDVTQPNSNHLLNSEMGIDGIKTGATDRGGFGIATTAIQDNRRVFIVNNGLSTSKARFDDALRSFRVAFYQYTEKNLYSKGDVIAEIPINDGTKKSFVVIAPCDILVLLPKNSFKSINVEIDHHTPLIAPIKNGDKVADIIVFSISNNDEKIILKTIPVFVDQNIHKISAIHSVFRKLFMIS